jgi:adenine-specific DNA-methyltransferase
VILSKISNLKNFELDKNKEIIQGIIGGPDEAFKLKNNELSLLSVEEKKYAKPFHTSTSRYYTPNNDEYILYISDKNIDRVSSENVPAIYSKLLPYQETLLSRREVLNGRKSWFSLWWERDEKFFLPGPKIVFAARTLGRNFTYTEDSFYASRNCFFIKTERANLKYLVGLLNSKLMHFFMDHNLKHNGDLLQLDKVQFLTVPLYCPSSEQQTPIIDLVNQILVAKKSNFSADTSSLECEIDRLVYELYGVTEEEITTIEDC